MIIQGESCEETGEAPCFFDEGAKENGKNRDTKRARISHYVRGNNYKIAESISVVNSLSAAPPSRVERRNGSAVLGRYYVSTAKLV